MGSRGGGNDCQSVRVRSGCREIQMINGANWTANFCRARGAGIGLKNHLPRDYYGIPREPEHRTGVDGGSDGAYVAVVG